jgi:hypothetical protein
MQATRTAECTATEGLGFRVHSKKVPKPRMEKSDVLADGLFFLGFSVLLMGDSFKGSRKIAPADAPPHTDAARSSYR